jgi:hypothetical protein
MKVLPFLLLAAFSLPASAAAPEYALHEWGTFTTVSGSDGGLLPGLQREEEGLPSFVESHAGMDNLGHLPTQSDGRIELGKGWIRPLKNVTVKMETPVIYFYTPEPFQAKVSVGFHGGSISQWYPSRSGGETMLPWEPDKPKPPLDFAQKYEGSIEWDVAVTPPTESDSATIFRGGETPNWLPAKTARRINFFSIAAWGTLNYPSSLRWKKPAYSPFKIAAISLCPSSSSMNSA